jgi:hypothetical protein
MGLVFWVRLWTSVMTVKKFGLILIGSILFVMLLVAEYLFCSVNYRFIRMGDLWTTDLICQLLAAGFCYWVFGRLMKEAFKEKIHLGIVLTLFLILSSLLGCFFRLTLQIANGVFDTSNPETKMVVVSSRDSSVFGASIEEGLNSIAYYVHFSDWDDKDKSCELLIPYSFYFEVGLGTNVELSLKKGLFGFPWVEDYRIMDE